MKYGGQINIFLRRSRQFLRTRKDSTAVEFSDVDDYSGLDKEFNFKILPKYKTNVDGDAVYYHDLFLLVDILGRYVTLDHFLWATLTESSFEGTAFRILPFLPYHVEALDAIKGGHVIQFYHTEREAWLAAVDARGRHVERDTSWKTSQSLSVETMPSVEYGLDSSWLVLSAVSPFSHSHSHPSSQRLVGDSVL